MQNRNLIDVALAEGKSTDETLLNSRFLINALTGQVIGATMSHCALARRGGDVDRPFGAVVSRTGEPTLDERNTMDLNAEADAITAAIRETQGFENVMPALKVAEICNALRLNVYDELARVRGVEKPTPDSAVTLFTTPQTDPLAPIDFDIPMSAEMFIDFRIKSAATPDPKRIKAAAQILKKTEAFVLEMARRRAVENVGQLKALKPEVMTEILSLDGAYENEAFKALPVQVQLRIADKLANYLNKEYQRLGGIFVDTLNLELGNKMAMVEANFLEVKAWIEETRKLSSALA